MARAAGRKSSSRPPEADVDVGPTPDVELCPRCGMREQKPPPDDPHATDSGFCRECELDHALERRHKRDTEELRARNAGWERQTSTAVHALENERSNAYRMRKRLKPRTPVRRGTDPWLIGDEAIRILTNLRQRARLAADWKAELDNAMECVRQLAWGPGPAPAPAPRRRSGRAPAR